jgi:hypothetical protein
MDVNAPDYNRAFLAYEDARMRYAELQEEIREFLARFTGDPTLLAELFVISDLARMEGLRAQRDDAYERFRRTEAEIFERLGRQWGPERRD